MKPMCEPMEEQMEIVLSSRQIFVLAILIVGVALVMFVVGFSMGKRAERRKLVVGTPQAAADLLTRLDEMEKQSREFVAKKALTEVRKQEIGVEELPPAPVSDRQNAPKEETSSSQASSASQVSAPQTGRKAASGTLALTRVKAVKTVPAKASNARPAAAPVSAAPVSQRHVSGSFGRTRRVEATAARRTEPRKVATRN